MPAIERGCGMNLPGIAAEMGLEAYKPCPPPRATGNERL